MRTKTVLQGVMKNELRTVNKEHGASTLIKNAVGARTPCTTASPRSARTPAKQQSGGSSNSSVRTQQDGTRLARVVERYTHALNTYRQVNNHRGCRHNGCWGVACVRARWLEKNKMRTLTRSPDALRCRIGAPSRGECEPQQLGTNGSG